ncbi:urease accessory protein UreD [Aurantimonas sp. HBX-1]|uniref:urease accessory protein UreD n=1 Tax=Aurantimonas sp. HBX-1 TaxID=2906072 RepID=UPI001F3AF8FC|nr:urease accessory protein UreD [Aurantimonas sp. HBX-1]UIJ72290.1 urease accessory protein UreD [Aurantimonas sp. HBX-1]
MSMDVLADDAAPAPGASMQRAAGAVAADFRLVAGRSRLQRLHQAGCLKLRFPRLPAAEAEAVLINTAGGLTGGDRLDQQFAVASGAHLTVTTQACERIYRASSGHAGVATRVHIDAGAGFAWLPQETILFEAGAVRRSLAVEADAASRFVLCESIILGRELMGETVETGLLHESWRVRVGGRLAFADDLHLSGAIAAATAGPASLGGSRALATVVAHAPDVETKLAAVRALAGDSGGASLVGGLMVVRLLAPTGFALRKRLMPVLAALANAPVPLVWSL